MVAVPTATPATPPDEVTVAIAALDDDHVTPELKLPVPVTWAVHCVLAPTLIEEAEHVTLTPVMLEDVVIVTFAEPDLVVSSVDVAVIVAVPAATPVTLPDELTVATLVFEDAQVTPVLKLPVPATVAVHEPEDPFVIDDGHVTETLVMVGGDAGGGVDPPPPPPPQALSSASSDAIARPFVMRTYVGFMRLPSRNLVLSVRSVSTRANPVPGRSR